MRDSQSAPFWLEDETGRALIKLEGATPLLKDNRCISVDSSTPAELLDRIAKRYNDHEKNGRYLEAILTQGARITVAGTVHMSVDGPTLQLEQDSELFVSNLPDHKIKNKIGPDFLGTGCTIFFILLFAIVFITLILKFGPQ